MKYIIIGNGVAGTTAASSIRNLDDNGEITILTDEAIPFYSRIMLIGYLSGETDEKGLVIHGDDWYAKNRIQLLLDTLVSGIDRDRKQVITATGQRLPYDRLLLATGGSSFVPPIAGSDKKGVFTLRNVHDARQIVRYAESVEHVLLIGGGVLGLEAGNSLRKTGHRITVAEFFPRLLPRQLDPEGAEMLRAQMEQMGFVFYLGARSREIVGEERVTGLILEDSRRIDTDLIIISAGIRPRSELAGDLGVPVAKGVPVNDRMETGLKDVYAAGDLIEHRGMLYGIWNASQRQGEVAGINMAGGEAAYEGTTLSNVLKVAGIDLAAAGDIDAEGKHESVVHRDRDTYTYKKLVIKEQVLSGCILYGDISGFRKVLKAIDEKRDIRDVRKSLERWDLTVL